MNNYRKLILKGQETIIQVNTIKRDIIFNEEYLELNKIISFIGPRRAGKTYYMFHTLKNLINSNILKLEQIIFIDFTSFLFEEFDIEKLLENFFELFPNSKPFFVFDEIQELDNFKKIVMYLYNDNYKIFLSGSNSKLLSSELSTIFRGRTIDIKIYPLNFKEFLFFKNIEIINIQTEKQVGLLNNLIKEFLDYGAYPEIVLINNNETKYELIKNYFILLLYKDLLERYGIENEYVIKFLTKKLLLGVTKEFNINKIFNELKSNNIKIGKQTIYNYLEYLKEIFFIKEIEDEFIKGTKKFFFYDVGYNNILLLENLGKRFENVVFSKLNRNFEKVLYRKKDNMEIDFIISEKDIAIQVCYELKQENIERETKYFRESNFKNKFLVYFSKDKNLIISNDIKLVNFLEFDNEINKF